MSFNLDIFPAHDMLGLLRLFIQIGIFILGLFVTQVFIIKPALKLQKERDKRTVGNTKDAQLLLEQAKELEFTYFSLLKEGAEAAKNLKAQEIVAARKKAEELITETELTAQAYIHKLSLQLQDEAKEEKLKLEEQSLNLSNKIISQLTSVSVLIFCFLLTKNIFAGNVSDIHLHEKINFWPYVQFMFFIMGAVYFGRKTVAEFLESQRDALRLRLSEARESVSTAKAKLLEYEDKLAKLPEEIEELKRKNLIDAKMECAKIMGDASRLCEHIRWSADRAAYDLVAREKTNLHNSLVDLSLEKTKKILNASQENAEQWSALNYEKIVESVKVFPRQNVSS